MRVFEVFKAVATLFCGKCVQQDQAIFAFRVWRRCSRGLMCTSCSFHPVAGQNATLFLADGPGPVLVSRVSPNHHSLGLSEVHSQRTPLPFAVPTRTSWSGRVRPSQAASNPLREQNQTRAHSGLSLMESHQPINDPKLPKVDPIRRVPFLYSSSYPPPHPPLFSSPPHTLDSIINRGKEEPLDH